MGERVRVSLRQKRRKRRKHRRKMKPWEVTLERVEVAKASSKANLRASLSPSRKKRRKLNLRKLDLLWSNHPCGKVKGKARMIKGRAHQQWRRQKIKKWR